MKIKLIFRLTLFVCLFGVGTIKAQTTASYILPDSYSFDFEVTQRISGNKNPTDSCTAHFFYTKSGNYAAARIGWKSNMKGNLFLVTTRDGIVILLDEHRKDITILSVRKILSDMSGLMKYIRMDSLMTHMQKNKVSKDFEFVKTGKTKPVGNYISEEYKLTERRGLQGFVWLAKIDFNGPADYILSALGGNFPQMMNMMNANSTSHPLGQALMQSNTLITDLESTDSTGARTMNMHTVSILPVSITVSTSGYQVNNYVNMTIPEIFQAEMKKRND